MVETPDGTQAGTETENGEFITEIDGSYVTTAGSEQRVLLPLLDGIEVTVSSDRLVEELQERGHDVASDDVQVSQELFVDIDPEFVETDDGTTELEGRTVRTATYTTGGDDGVSEPVVPATVDLEPKRVNIKSNGNFITAHIGLPETGDPSDIDLSTVQLQDVSAVTDEQYGFTTDPPVETRGGEKMAMVKFPRDEVIDAFEPGTHEVPVTGLAADHMFLGTTQLELFEPGSGNGNGNKSTYPPKTYYRTTIKRLQWTDTDAGCCRCVGWRQSQAFVGAWDDHLANRVPLSRPRRSHHRFPTMPGQRLALIWRTRPTSPRQPHQESTRQWIGDSR